VVARVAGGNGKDIAKRVRSALTVDHTRAFDQDPRFALLVVSEVASHALSPALNDEGTAIDVIGRLSRLLLDYRPCPEAPRFPDVVLPRLQPAELVHAAFGPIVRDGAGHAAVMLRLQETLLALIEEGDAGYAEAARALSRDGAALAARALALPGDAEAVQVMALRVADAQGANGAD
jgi:uncharacterized membrane protein